jgi:hypothetical protein
MHSYHQFNHAPVSLARLHERLATLISALKGHGKNDRSGTRGKRIEPGTIRSLLNELTKPDPPPVTEAIREGLISLRSAICELVRLQREHVNTLADLIRENYAESQRREEHRWRQLVALFDRTLAETRNREEHLIEKLRADEECRMAAQLAADERRWEYIAKTIWMQQHQHADGKDSLPSLSATTTTTTTTSITTTDVTTHTNNYTSPFPPVTNHIDSQKHHHDIASNNKLCNCTNRIHCNMSNTNGLMHTDKSSQNRIPTQNGTPKLPHNSPPASATTSESTSTYENSEARDFAALNASLRLLRDEIGERQTRLENAIHHISMQQTAILQELRRSLYHVGNNGINDDS